MGDKSRIEWTEATWNPVTGCSKVSPGCAHCYAETLALTRLAGKTGYPGLPWTPANARENVVLRPERLDQPLRWKRPRMIFTNSMSDLFHEQIPDHYIAEVFAVMGRARWHVFQVLTKRPERMRELLGSREWRDEVEYHRQAIEPELAPASWPLPNVWLGTSIENRRYVERADYLRCVPAAVRFISAEPLLGPLVYDGAYSPVDHPWEDRMWSDFERYDGPELDLAGIHWLIVGGESGPGHRAMDLAWVRDLRDACHSHQRFQQPRARFFFKQLGGARSGSALEDFPPDLRIREMPTGTR